MSIQKIEQFHVIGISVRTTNENEQASTDIPALWAKFMAEQIAEKIPNKIDSSLYCLYIDYEKDHTKPYTTLLGCKVEHLNNIPEGMMGKTIAGGNYEQYVAKGNLMEGAVYNAWLNIWEAPIQRIFTADFEVYGTKAENPQNAEVDLFIAVK